MLLILAGVALATLTGQGNIIGNAENAVGKYNNSVAGEQQLLNEIEKYFQNYLQGGNVDNPPTPPEPPKVDSDGLAMENVTITTDEENVQIVIPVGFAPAILTGSNSTYSLPGQDGSVKEIMPADQWNNITSEQINQGIVIVDHAITYTEGVPDFNEYVWISIPSIEENFKEIAWNGPYRAESHTNGEHPIVQNPTTEDDKKNKFWDYSPTTEDNIYTSMLTSVEFYKGFYIGRYEASEGDEKVAQSKRNQAVWRYVTHQEAIDSCESNTIENMHLLYGIEWDSVLNWLIGKATISSDTIGETKTMEIEDIQANSCSWGNYSNSTGDAKEGSDTLQNTGVSEYWKANNIYDIAGNVWEWTQEKYSIGSSKVCRSGNYSSNEGGYPAACRINDDVNLTSYDLRFSCQLFCNTGRW